MADGKPWEKYARNDSGPWKKYGAASGGSSSIGPEPYAIQPMMIGPFQSGVRQSTMRKATATLPYVGAGVGAAAGEGLASIPGAALGGAAGESIRQLTNRFFGLHDQETETSMGAAKEIGKAGIEQGAIEAATAGVGRLAKPVAGALKESAAKGLGKVLEPTTIANKTLTKKVLPRMVEEAPIAMSRKGLLGNVNKSLRVAGDALDDALKAVPNRKQLNPGQITAVTSALDDLADSLKVDVSKPGYMQYRAPAPGSEASVEFIERMRDMVKNADPSFGTIREMRQVLDGLVDKTGKWNATAAEGSQKEIQRFTANRLREELASAAPDVAAANKDYSFYKGMQTVLEHTIERKTGQQGNLTKRILMAGGASHGITGVAVMKALGDLVDSTAWRTTSAATKSKIANLIATDRLGEAAGLIARTGGAAIASQRAGNKQNLPPVGNVVTPEEPK